MGSGVRHQARDGNVGVVPRTDESVRLEAGSNWFVFSSSLTSQFFLKLFSEKRCGGGGLDRKRKMLGRLVRLVGTSLITFGLLVARELQELVEPNVGARDY